MRSRVGIAGVLAVLVVAVAVGFAQEGKERPLRPEPDVNALIEKLGDESYEVRTKAEEEILALGEKAVPFLEKAAKEHADHHVRFEADRLLRQIRGRAEAGKDRPFDARGWRELMEAQEKWVEDMLRRLAERGLLVEEDLKELLDESFDHGSRKHVESVKGVIERDGERIEYERKPDGSVTVKRTRDGDTKTWEAESLEALREKAPEAYDLVRDHLGGGGFIRLGRDPFRFLLPPRADPLAPGDLPGVDERRAAPGGFRLGIWVGEISEALRAHLKLPEGEGILVEDVVPGSLADRMGVKRLDVIRKVNGTPVGEAADVRKSLAGVEEGGQVELQVIRRGDPLTLLGTR